MGFRVRMGQIKIILLTVANGVGSFQTATYSAIPYTRIVDPLKL